MRDALCAELVARAADPSLVFLTGDLGFMALEPLQTALGPRFINCGVAEQNMVSVAAALASEGLQTWTYTIAPFCYARAFEQIRNDICLHNLPVKLLANGGGYGYGVMGPTHHALEDYGVLLTLPGMHVLVPAFTQDIAATIARAAITAAPTYIRLGRGELPKGQTAPAYAPWRCLLPGYQGAAITTGPIAGVVWDEFLTLDPANRPSLWLVSELPITANPPPGALIAALAANPALLVIEEHVSHGGLGAMICAYLVHNAIPIARYQHLFARGYPTGTYGSQNFLRDHAGLSRVDMHAAVRAIGGGI